MTTPEVLGKILLRLDRGHPSAEGVVPQSEPSHLASDEHRSELVFSGRVSKDGDWSGWSVEEVGSATLLDIVEGLQAISKAELPLTGKGDRDRLAKHRRCLQLLHNLVEAVEETRAGGKCADVWIDLESDIDRIELLASELPSPLEGMIAAGITAALGRLRKTCTKRGKESTMPLDNSSEHGDPGGSCGNQERGNMRESPPAISAVGEGEAMAENLMVLRKAAEGEAIAPTVTEKTRQEMRDATGSARGHLIRMPDKKAMKRAMFPLGQVDVPYCSFPGHCLLVTNKHIEVLQREDIPFEFVS